jgi:hypothetical protein
MFKYILIENETYGDISILTSYLPHFTVFDSSGK